MAFFNTPGLQGPMIISLGAPGFEPLTLNGTNGANTLLMSGSSGSIMSFTNGTLQACPHRRSISRPISRPAPRSTYTGGTTAARAAIQAGTLIAQNLSALPG